MPAYPADVYKVKIGFGQVIYIRRSLYVLATRVAWNREKVLRVLVLGEANGLVLRANPSYTDFSEEAVKTRRISF